MRKFLEHMGYTAQMEYSAEDGVYYGRVWKITLSTSWRI